MERKWCFDRLRVLQEAIVTQGCTFVSCESLINVKDTIPQVIFNNKVFNQWTVPRHSRMGSICHSSVVSSTQCTRDNDDVNIDFSSQHDLSATWELSEKMEEWTYTTNYQMQYSWDPRAVLGSRKTEGSYWNVFWSYCGLAQTLETVQLLISY